MRGEEDRCQITGFEVDDFVVPKLGVIARLRRGQQLLTTGLLMLLMALAAIGGCANISVLTQQLSGSRLADRLPSLLHTVPQTPSSPAAPEQLKTLTPFAIAAGPDGNLWFSELRKSQIGRITPAAEISTFDLGSGALAERLTAGPDDAIWFTDPAGNRIGRLGLDGTTAYVPLPTPESGPAAIINASDGNLWFTEHAVDRVARITPLGTLTEFSLLHSGGPAGIAEGSDSKLYIAENSGDRIDQMSMDGRFQEFPLPMRGARPDGIVKAAGGDIWFTEFGAEKVGRLTVTGRITEYALAAQGLPVGIAAGLDGNIWVTIPTAHAICKVAPDGSQGVYYLQSDIMPGMIAAGSDGNLWFTQPNGKLGRFSPFGIVREFPAVPNARTASRTETEHLLISAP
ncbi:MAG: virginiamycin B lyase [Deltaproteobacteria bacterium]|nr:virginiamycin B lyase [Deltaproteobacteria bacterium]